MIQSLNFRLADSLPRHVLEKWMNELELIRRDDGNPENKNRRDAGGPRHAGASGLGPPASRRLPDHARREMELRRRIEEFLDVGHGECWLRRPDIAALVEAALFHFDGQRYRLLAWCIMPNHVHALIETREGFPLADVLHSWKSFTSHQANKLLKRTGEFWQREYLDRYVRNAEHFEKVLAYIEENPVKAGLAKLKTEWPWSSARFRNPGTAGVPPAGAAGVPPAV